MHGFSHHISKLNNTELAKKLVLVMALPTCCWYDDAWEVNDGDDDDDDDDDDDSCGFGAC